MDWTATEGTRFPLGASWVEKDSAWNFALYSEHAESVTLLLYTDADLVNPVFTYRFNYLRNKSGRIWHCQVAQAILRQFQTLKSDVRQSARARRATR